MLEYLEPFNSVQKVVIFIYKKFWLIQKKRLPPNYWLMNHMYNHLTVCKQMSSDSFTNVIDKLCVYRSCIKIIWHQMTFKRNETNQSEAIYDVSVHHLLLFYQPKWVPSMAWTVLVMWYTCCKLTCTNSFPNKRCLYWSVYWFVYCIYSLLSSFITCIINLEKN